MVRNTRKDSSLKVNIAAAAADCARFCSLSQTPFGLNSDTIVHKIATKLHYLHLVNIFSNVNKEVKKTGNCIGHHLMSTELQAIWRTKSLDFDMRKYHVKNQAKILGQGFFNSGGDSKELKYFMSFISLLLLQIICILKRKFYFCRSQSGFYF